MGNEQSDIGSETGIRPVPCGSQPNVSMVVAKEGLPARVANVRMLCQ